jgi:hypothetical protein
MVRDSLPGRLGDPSPDGSLRGLLFPCLHYSRIKTQKHIRLIQNCLFVKLSQGRVQEQDKNPKIRIPTTELLYPVDSLLWSAFHYTLLVIILLFMQLSCLSRLHPGPPSTTHSSCRLWHRYLANCGRKDDKILSILFLPVRLTSVLSLCLLFKVFS